MDIGTTWKQYDVRWAMESEWSPCMVMVWKTFLQFEGRDYSQEGIKNFFDFITDNKLYVSFLKGEYQLMVAVDRGKIIGAGSIRSRNHLSLLFVDGAYHHQGVGSTILRNLCDYLKTEAGEKYMTLQASPYAVDFYRRQGFHALQSEMVISGMRVTPMEKKL